YPSPTRRHSPTFHWLQSAARCPSAPPPARRRTDSCDECHSAQAAPSLRGSGQGFDGDPFLTHFQPFYHHHIGVVTCANHHFPLAGFAVAQHFHLVAIVPGGFTQRGERNRQHVFHAGQLDMHLGGHVQTQHALQI